MTKEICRECIERGILECASLGESKDKDLPTADEIKLAADMVIFCMKYHAHHHPTEQEIATKKLVRTINQAIVDWRKE